MRLLPQCPPPSPPHPPRFPPRSLSLFFSPTSEKISNWISFGEGVIHARCTHIKKITSNNRQPFPSSSFFSSLSSFSSFSSFSSSSSSSSSSSLTVPVPAKLESASLGNSHSWKIFREAWKFLKIHPASSWVKQINWDGFSLFFSFDSWIESKWISSWRNRLNRNSMNIFYISSFKKW